MCSKNKQLKKTAPVKGDEIRGNCVVDTSERLKTEKKTPLTKDN
jgi:hypothetical protein